ncbi:hypothetical protein [Sphingomonas sp. ABOLH]|uniref:hypothetical protein n=1 Tax=Sphingomonas sp. ABOLH TaxID=1985881 RepID=UPI000F7E11DA|nr:hypothetical protein [Sphingomonas sp. ABOLH]RSV32191.1 hypothetical protein CA237_03770 [Sphingomonas sp. ABOLH]
MARKKTAESRARKSTTFYTVAQPLTPALEATIAPAWGSARALARMLGTGGEVAREEGVTRITGRTYATSTGTVPAAEIYFVNGAKPRDDPRWLGEADKLSWIDPATGYECIMLRDSGEGFLSGYVGVPEAHPLFGWDHDAVPTELGIDVHGGLTYSRICDDGPSPQRRLIVEAKRICHVVVGVIPLLQATEHRAGDGHWWFGFRCNHVYDVVPGSVRDRQRFMGAETAAEYRDDGYVVREVRNLAAQLRAIADGKPVPEREGPPLPAVGLDPQRGGR